MQVEAVAIAGLERLQVEVPGGDVGEGLVAVVHGSALRVTLLARQAARRLTQIDAQIKAIDEVARALTKRDPDLNRRRAIRSIRGFAETTAIALLADMPELGTTDEKQAAALAGLSPMNRQSGTLKGKSRIQGGRGHVRQTLFITAMAATRFTTKMKAKLEELVAAGEPAKSPSPPSCASSLSSPCAMGGFGR